MNNLNLTGTIKTLTSTINFNGRTLNAVEFGVLASVFGEQFGKKVGSYRVNPTGKGKPATIWELSPNAPVTFTALIAEEVQATTETESDEVSDQRLDDAIDTPLV